MLRAVSMSVLNVPAEDLLVLVGCSGFDHCTPNSSPSTKDRERGKLSAPGESTSVCNKGP